MEIFCVIIWLSINSLKGPREAACPYYAEGHGNEKEEGWEKGKRASRWKWSKWIWASCLPQISAFSLVAALLTYVFNRRESSQFPSHFLAVTFTCHRLGSCLLYKMHPGFVSCTLCRGSLRERKYQLARICIEPYGDWDSDWIGPPQTTIHPPPPHLPSPLAVPCLCMTNLLH